VISVPVFICVFLFAWREINVLSLLLFAIFMFRFYIIPLGSNSVSRGLAARCPVYASLFLDENWRDLLEKERKRSCLDTFLIIFLRLFSVLIPVTYTNNNRLQERFSKSPKEKKTNK
jgi:hypothetical protein